VIARWLVAVLAGWRTQREPEPASPPPIAVEGGAAPADVEQWIAEGRVHVLDVRRPDETAQGVVPGSQLIPLDQLAARAGELPADDKPIVVVCRSGRRSKQAADLLRAGGRSNVIELRGGLMAWQGPLVPPGTSSH
jgi:rhodanese-related sulfurtransferase